MISCPTDSCYKLRVKNQFVLKTNLGGPFKLLFQAFFRWSNILKYFMILKNQNDAR